MIKWAFDITLICDPPTITHQAKKIGYFRRRTAGGSKMTPRLIDDARLAGAIRTYLVLLIQRKCLDHPLSGAIELDLVFMWDGHAEEEEDAWYCQKPDWDNAAKTLQDCLVKAGYIQRDELVVRCTVTKLRGHRGCVRIRGRELLPYAEWLKEANCDG